MERGCLTVCRVPRMASAQGSISVLNLSVMLSSVFADMNIGCLYSFRKGKNAAACIFFSNAYYTNMTSILTERRGRPLLSGDESDPTRPVQTKLPDSMIQRLDGAAKRAGLKRAAAIREACEQWLERREGS